MVVPPAIIRSHSTLKARTTKTTLETLDPSNVEDAARSFEVYEGSPNEYSYKYGELKQRTNLDCMSESQVEKLRWAFRELYRFNKWPEDRRSYNNMALIHQNHCQHGWERFLPWHRVYLYELEQALQDVCPGITMPYWDLTMPQYCPEHPEKGSIIPPAYKAYLTKESIEYLVKHANPPLPAKAGATLLKKMVEPGLRYTSQTTFFAAVAEDDGQEVHRRQASRTIHRCAAGCQLAVVPAALSGRVPWRRKNQPGDPLPLPDRGGHGADPRAAELFATSAAAASTMIRSASSIRIRTTRCTSGPAARTRITRPRLQEAPMRNLTLPETATAACR